MTDGPDQRHRYGRVEVSRRVTVVFTERRELVQRELEMLNVGLGGCLLKGELATGTQVGVLALRDLFIIGRVMPGADAGTVRVEWAPDEDDAEHLIASYALPAE